MGCDEGGDQTWTGTKQAAGHPLALGLSITAATPPVLQVILMDNS